MSEPIIYTPPFANQLLAEGWMRPSSTESPALPCVPPTERVIEVDAETLLAIIAAPAGFKALISQRYRVTDA